MIKLIKNWWLNRKGTKEYDEWIKNHRKENVRRRLYRGMYDE